jgi:hypothetical protein
MLHVLKALDDFSVHLPSPIMSFFQRIISIALVPIIALIAVQTWSPNFLNDPVGSAQLYAENIPIVHRYLVGTTPSRSETPLVITAFAHWSHYEKVSKVAVALAEFGYPVTFITGQIFENDVNSLHPKISFAPIQGRPDKFSEEEYEELKAYEPGSAEQGLFMMKKALVGGIPDQHNTLQQVFRAHQDLHRGGKPLISLYDAPFAGHHPVLLGAPGVKPDASLAISCHPLSLDSDDTYPFYMSTPPSTGSNATAIHREANRPENMDYATREVSKAYWQQLKELGASTKDDWHIYHTISALPDYLMTMGVPQFEFPRTDLRPNVHYFGAITSSKETVSQSELPEWWSDVAAAKQDGKKIVAVSQGSLAMDFNELLIPTLDALKDRTDVLVVATTVAVEVEDVKDLVIPSNARVAKFVPYDLLLPQVCFRPSYRALRRPSNITRSTSSSTMAATARSSIVCKLASLWSSRERVKTRTSRTLSSTGNRSVSTSAP